MDKIPYSPMTTLELKGQPYRSRLCLIAWTGEENPRRVTSPEILSLLCKEYHLMQIRDIGMDLFDREEGR